MSHWRRIVMVVYGLVAVLVLIVILTRLAGPVFNVAEGMEIAKQGSPFYGAYDFIKNVSYALIVPIFILAYYGWLIVGPAQDELQQERRRRGL